MCKYDNMGLQNQQSTETFWMCCAKGAVPRLLGPIHEMELRLNSTFFLKPLQLLTCPSPVSCTERNKKTHTWAWRWPNKQFEYQLPPSMKIGTLFNKVGNGAELAWSISSVFICFSLCFSLICVCLMNQHHIVFWFYTIRVPLLCFFM